MKAAKLTLDMSVHPSVFNGGWQSVCFGNDRFVAVGRTSNNNGHIKTSLDGVNWTYTQLGSNLTSVCYGNGRFVAVGSGLNGIFYSADGYNWTQCSSRATVGGGYFSVCYSNNLFVMVSATNMIQTSVDGDIWTDRTSPVNAGWRSITHGAGVYAAIAMTGTANRAMSSTNGTSWTSRSGLGTAYSFRYVNFGNGRFIVTGNNVSRIGTSTNGTTWSLYTTPTGVVTGSTCFANNLWLMAGASEATQLGYIPFAISSDGLAWENISTLNGVFGRSSICYGKGMYIMVDANELAQSVVVKATLSQSSAKTHNTKLIAI